MAEKETTQKKSPKSPVLAGFLGLIPGVGAIYNGQVIKGIVFIFIYAGLISMQQHEAIQPLAAFALTGFVIYLIIDAVQTANRINRLALTGDEVEEEKIEEFPKAMKAGSIFWGAVLMALGFVFLLANFEVISYGTVFDFWPVFIIVIGIKLVIDYFSKKK
jgi:TM2 domain-containing membrane protein YozV